MLSDNTVSLVKGLDIVEVISRYVQLKQRGGNYTGLSPFTTENSPSFTVSAPKQIFKCFSTGIGGDAIKFVMENSKLNFVEAVKEIALAHNIAVEYDATKQQTPEEQESTELLYKINEAAKVQFSKQLLDILNKEYSEHWTFKEIFNNRALSLDTVIQFGLGFAPDVNKFLTERIIEKGHYKPALELGIIKTSNSANWDTFRNRIIFPIHDRNGHVVGFGGRKPQEDANKENPKYINSSDSKIYKKNEQLYGLYFAQSAIRKHGKALLVEGYYDVISMHQAGVEIAIASCGTALTKTQIKILKRYCQHVIIGYDNDDKARNAGLEAALKSIDMLLEEGFKVEVLQFPKGEDADTFARKFTQQQSQKETEKDTLEEILEHETAEPTE